MLEVTDLQNPLSEEHLRSIISEALQEGPFRNKRVLAVVPDETRTCPLPLLFETAVEALRARAAKLTFLVALGTHAVPETPSLLRPFGLTEDRWREKYSDIPILPHRWEDPDTFVQVGSFPPDRIAELTGGLFTMPVRVAINKLALQHDVILIIGPVFPHEVVGFSGGHKYLFPGIGEKEFINFFHWLGAVITNPKINGNRDTPVRRLVEEAARFVPSPRFSICLVVKGPHVHGVFCGGLPEAWERASELSAKINIVYEDRPYKSVLACVPEMYKDIWLAGKGMYKLENVVADGGELIIYGPHIKEISYSHGRVLDEIGYHVRDYFLKQWDRFKQYPWGVLAHSTHVRGIGTYDQGVERPRIKVTLATGIPEERCKRVCLGYRDPRSIDPREWEERREEGYLCVHHAGEVLYRLKDPPPWARPD